MNYSEALWKERREASRKVAGAVLASIFFHIFLILLIAWFFRGSKNTLLVQKKEEAKNEVTMNLVSMNLASPAKPKYLETNADQATDQAPQRVQFESDKNTRAASELPARGQAPLPTLDGKQSDSLQFQDREYAPGKESGGSLPSTASQASRPQEEKKQAQTRQERVDWRAEALAPQSHIPTTKPESHQEASQQTSQAASPSVNAPAQPASPAERQGYQSETRVVRIDGSISNRGRAAMDVVATPLGRYKRLLSNAIGARWYYLVQRDMDMYRIGTVAIRFKVSQSGKVEAVKVVSNTSNELLAATSIQSITDAEMPAIPSDVAASLHEGRIEVDYSFSIISN